MYNYNKLDTDKCFNLLAQVIWTNMIESNTIDVSTTNFTDIFLDIATQCMPVIVRQNGVPWLSEEIRNSSTLKNRKLIHRKAKQSNLEADWIKFRQFRNYVISKIRNRKIEFLTELGEKNKTKKNQQQHLSLIHI